jgi:hypothetical protein
MTLDKMVDFFEIFMSCSIVIAVIINPQHSDSYMTNVKANGKVPQYNGFQKLFVFFVT